MTVAVVPYSDAWPSRFEKEAARLHRALSLWLAGPVEHIGSTAVQGLAAKPILDMLAPIRDLDAARDAVDVLTRLGYQQGEHRPHEALWFYRQTREDQSTRTHQLHLTRPDSALWRERLAFRDALRAEPRLVAEYQALKQALAGDGRDLAAYTAGKRTFIAAVLRQAGVELV